MNTPLQGIPTNVVSGFLGSGKTTTLLHLLKTKPADERWAVLVNEFGEVGVDGSLFQGLHSEQGGVFVKEVPGGCMCCTAGLPMQIALNQLLTRARPDRLLIEPTGLGHPKEVLAVLTSDYLQKVLVLQTCVALVDARKLADTRYTSHATFNEQLQYADLIIGSKHDLYTPGDEKALQDYIALHNSAQPMVVFAEYGRISPSLLMGPSKVVNRLQHVHHHPPSSNSTLDDAMPACGYLKVENTGEGYRSVGWRISPEHTFAYDRLCVWLGGLTVERLKGVFITDKGVLGVNMTRDTLTEMPLDDCLESRVEIINEILSPEWESELLATRVESGFPPT